MKTDNKASLRGSIMLLLAALFWGIAFVAQSSGMDYVGPFTFNCVRSLLGSAALIPVIIIIDKNKSVARRAEEQNHPLRLIAAGGICGIVLFGATMLQQFGLITTTAGKAGFITALYIIIVPILGIFKKRFPHPAIIISVAVATFGMYLLCVGGEFKIASGDIAVMFCAILFSVHIMVIDYFAPRVDGVKMSCIQFLINGIISGVCMFIFEQPTWEAIWSARIPILYTGIMSSGVAYTFQILGQGSVEPVLASLLMSLESVFSALAGWIILKERLSAKEFLGCVLIFAAVVLAQVSPVFSKKKAKHEKQITMENNKTVS